MALFHWKILGVLLVFSWCSPNYDVVFKITNRLKVNNYKFNGDFKSYITVRRTLEKQLAFSFFISLERVNLKTNSYTTSVQLG
jgi:hypothetical protein